MQRYHIRKKFVNFVIFSDDKDPQIFFLQNAKINEIYYILYTYKQVVTTRVNNHHTRREIQHVQKFITV